MTLAQTGNYSRWLTKTQIKNGFEITNPTSIGQISALDEAGNPTFTGTYPITEKSVGQTLFLINNWNGDWATNTQQYVPSNFTGGFIEKMEKDLKENPGNKTVWGTDVQFAFQEITEENWQPLASLVNRGFIINLGAASTAANIWFAEKYAIQQCKMEQPENAFSLRVPTVGSASNMAYLLATSIFGLQNKYPSEEAFNNQMSNLGYSSFTERMNYILENLIGDVSQASWTNAQNGTGGIRVFSQEVLNEVVYNGYCSTSPSDAGYQSGDSMGVTLNALGSGISNPFISAVSTATLGSNWAWNAGITYNEINSVGLAYDVWASNSAFLNAVQSGNLLLWNKNVTVPSSNTIEDLVAQTTPYTGTYTGAFPVLPSTAN
jgi:hypothetical protein